CGRPAVAASDRAYDPSVERCRAPGRDSGKRSTAMSDQGDPDPIPPYVAARALDIPYLFARRHGVVLLPEEDGRLAVAMREGSDPRTLLEVRRHLARSFDVRFVDAAQFDRHLSDHYAMEGSAAAMAGSIDMGADELDMLAADIPTADDLLDSADDAPAIRLINGIIAE